MLQLADVLRDSDAALLHAPECRVRKPDVGRTAQENVLAKRLGGLGATAFWLAHIDPEALPRIPTTPVPGDREIHAALSGC